VELSELSDLELQVLVGLVKLVVHADREISAEERQVLATVQEAVGVSRWNQAVRAARDAYELVEQLEIDAKALDRVDAQQQIHAVLLRLAGSDEIIDAEAHVLQWVVEEWGLVEEQHEESVETFVMLDE
jgi:glyceraldehyde-3-phosphate dehydrogenase/erythrose-4-phosphate dehydrogenase